MWDYLRHAYPDMGVTKPGHGLSEEKQNVFPPRLSGFDAPANESLLYSIQSRSWSGL